MESTCEPAAPAPLGASGAPAFRPALYAFAVGTVVVIFALIALGGAVTSRGAGLAVPDWPTTYQQNMFLYPVSQWTGGVFWEHTHRLLGSLAGLCTIVLAAWLTFGETRQPARCAAAWAVTAAVGGFVLYSLANKQVAQAFYAIPSALIVGVWLTAPHSRRPWVTVAAWLLLGMVVVQGFMGGLRVTEQSVPLAVVHGITGQLVLCLAVFLAAATSKWWLSPLAQGGEGLAALRPLCLVLLGVLLVQLTLGAALRHYGAGLAIPDFPAAYGRLVPPMSQVALDRATAAQGLPSVAAWQVHLAFTHRLWALAVIGMILWVIARVGLVAAGAPKFRRPALALLALLLAQIALGALVIWTGRQPEVATAHQAVGAAILATAALLTMRLFAISRGETPGGVPARPVDRGPGATNRRTTPLAVTADHLGGAGA